MQTDGSAGEYQTKTEEEVPRLTLNLGPPLPSEVSRPPWPPKVAGIIAFFFGPVAGALVVVSSLRRMRFQERARKVMLLALVVATVEAALLFFVPEAQARAVAFGAEIAFLLVFPAFMERPFHEWQAAHPDAKPASGWSAIGWGLAGVAAFLVIAFLVQLGLSSLLPAGR